MKSLKHSSKGFLFSMEALLAMTAFSMTCALILNLIHNGSKHAVQAFDGLSGRQSLKKMLCRELLSPENRVQQPEALNIENVTLLTQPINEKATLKVFKDYLQLKQALPGHVVDLAGEPKFKPDQASVGGPQLFMFVANHQDEEKQKP